MVISLTRDLREWNDALNKLTNFELDLQKLLADNMEKAAIETVQTARQRAHVITGNMRSSISHTKLGLNEWEVGAYIDYAVYENARGPPHDFFDQAVDAVSRKYGGIVQEDVRAWIIKK